MNELEEYQREEKIFEEYHKSSDYSSRVLERLKITDATDRNAEAKILAWQLCERKDNPVEGCIFFIENFGWTFDPRRIPYHLPFILYDYQKEAIKWFVEHIDEGKDGLVEKSRDMGVTWLTVWIFLWYWLFRDGTNLLVGSYKEALVDDKTDDSIFGKLDYALSNLPNWILPRGYNHDKHRTKLRLINPVNKNLISGDTMNANFGRGSRKTAIFFDELGSWDYAKDAWASSGDTTRCRLANSTPKGFNFYAQLRNSGIDVMTLHWSRHPLKDEQWYLFQKSRRSVEEIAQELDISYQKSQERRVYPEWDETNVETGFFEYNPGLPLYVGWDFGREDPTTIIWSQPYKGKLRIIDTYTKTGKNIDFFVPFVTGVVSSDNHYSKEDLEVIIYHHGWKKGIHFGDPAGRFRNQVVDATVLSTLRQYGIIINYNNSWNVFQNRRRAAKSIILSGIELNKNSRTEYFSMCILNSVYKKVRREGNEDVKTDKPDHNWASHFRSAFEYLCLGISEFTERSMKPFDKFKTSPYDRSGRRRVIGY